MVEYFYLCDRYAVRRPHRLERASRAVTFHGDIAQMVERLNGIQKVRGSIPLISTKTKTRNAIGRSGSFILSFSARAGYDNEYETLILKNI